MLVVYSVVASLSALLMVLLLSTWRRRYQGTLLLATAASFFFWALHVTTQWLMSDQILQINDLVEFLRNFFLIIFLSRLLQSADEPGVIEQAISLGLVSVSYGISLMLLVLYALGKLFPDMVAPAMSGIMPWGGLITSILLLLLAISTGWCGRQQPHARSMIIISLIFSLLAAFDLIFYTRIVFSSDGDTWWFLRAVVAISVLVTLLWVTRMAESHRIAVYISRAFLNYFIVAGTLSCYLLLVAFSRQLLHLQHGHGMEFFTLVAAMGFIMIIVLVVYRPLRDYVQVYIDKHFREYKYEYREEWLNLIRNLSREDSDLALEQRSIQVLANIIDSRGGNLWVRVNKYQFYPTAYFNLPEMDSVTESTNSAFCQFLEMREWVFNLDEYYERPDLYGNLPLPDWLAEIPDCWLIVPLMLQKRLYGFVVLLKPNRKKDFNWEDIELLRTAGQQVAIHLSEARSTLALLEARQFEAFNRLSAYVVHDLKNVISQLDLVVRNAEKHGKNPAFMEDAMSTVGNASNRMQRLLTHLKGGKQDVIGHSLQRVELGNLLLQLVEKEKNARPVPFVQEVEPFLWAEVDAEKLLSVLGHLVQNAQDATPATGYIELSVRRAGGYAIISLEDNGKGMDADFIRERLFKPFDSTKGLTGMGIGAHEAKEFIEHGAGGRIEVESEPDRGTLFKIWIPLVDHAEY